MSAFGLAATLATGKLPDPGQITIVPAAAAVGGVIAAWYRYLRSGSLDAAIKSAEVGGLAGASLGLLVYLGVLLGGVP